MALLTTKAKAKAALSSRAKIERLEAKAKQIKADIAKEEKAAIDANLLDVSIIKSDVVLAPARSVFDGAFDNPPAYLSKLELRGVQKFFDRNKKLKNKTIKVWFDLDLG
tara:strand:+ start:68 stop:394 length:327 start_codon:yes stop_codon:yes gene_type:complete